MFWQCTHRSNKQMYGKKCCKYGMMNYFKAVCRSIQRQRKDQRLPQRSKVGHEVQQDEKPYTN